MYRDECLTGDFAFTVAEIDINVSDLFSLSSSYLRPSGKLASTEIVDDACSSLSHAHEIQHACFSIYLPGTRTILCSSELTLEYKLRDRLQVKYIEFSRSSTRTMLLTMNVIPVEIVVLSLRFSHSFPPPFFLFLFSFLVWLGLFELQSVWTFVDSLDVRNHLCTIYATLESSSLLSSPVKCISYLYASEILLADGADSDDLDSDVFEGIEFGPFSSFLRFSVYFKFITVKLFVIMVS